MNTTLSSSSAVIAFPPPAAQPGFAQASKAWLNRWHEDARLTHAERTLITRIYIGFNHDHFETTGELIAWPGWETIEAEGRLSEASIDRGLKKLQRLGALEVLKRGYNPKTGWRLPSRYRALTPKPLPAEPPLRMKGGHPSPCKVATSQDERRLGDSDSVNPVSKNLSDGVKQARTSLPNKEEERRKPESPLSLDPQALLQNTAREVVRATPRSARAWRWHAPDKVAEAEATLERYRKAAAEANGGAS
jgi:hypothetical protein